MRRQSAGREDKRKDPAACWRLADGSGPGNVGCAAAFLRRAGAFRWGGGGGVLCVCVSTSWAAAREFGPRHTPAPRSTLAHGEPFAREEGRARRASGICFQAAISHKFIARLDKYQISLPRLILPIAWVVVTKKVALEQTIAATSTNRHPNMAAQEPNPNAPSTSTTSPANILTYHCLCTQLSLATTAPLEALPKRQLDAAAIATCGDFASASEPTLTMQALSLDDKATVLKLDDGFEKRYAVRCTRCGLAAGYHLDKSQFSGSESETGPRTDVVYILPGGLLTTEEMREGRSMEAEVGKVALAATS